MSEPFSSTLRRGAQQVWDRIFSHPFIREVQSGELPLDKFRYYMIQDYLYLEGFGQAVSAALARAQDSETIRKLTRRLTTPIERPFQLKMLELLEIEVQEAERARRSPTNRAYVDHMLVAAQSGTVGEAAAALLPCPWTYHEIGSRLSGSPHPIFAEWIEIYSAGFLEESITRGRWGRSRGMRNFA